MFCGKCGTQNPDEAEFCKGCGARLKSSSEIYRTMAVNPSENVRYRKIGMVTVGILAVVILVIVFGLFGGRSYKSTINRYVKATYDGDAKAIVDLIPNKVVDYAMEEEGYDKDDLNEFIEEGEETLKDQMDSLDSYLGENWKLTHKIVDTVDISEDDLDDLKDDYQEMDVKISAAKELEIELTIQGAETEASNSITVNVIKVGRSWYLDVLSMGNMF